MSVRGKRATRQLMTAAKVKKIVSNLAEKKVVQHEATNQVAAYNQTSFGSNGIIPVSPYSTYLQVDQGTSQDQRIGNKIRPMRTTLDMNFVAQNYNGTTNTNPTPQQIRVVVFSMKDNNDLPTTLPYFFQQGSSSTTPLSNGFDMILPINRDLYTVYEDFRVKLGASIWEVSPGTTAVQGYFANNDFDLNPIVRLDLSKHIPNVVTYNDNNSAPTSRAVFVTWFTARSDGVTSASSQIPASVFYSLKCTYTDD